MQSENKIINCHYKLNDETIYGKLTYRIGIMHALEHYGKKIENAPNDFLCFSETNEVILLNDLCHEDAKWNQCLLYRNLIKGFYNEQETKDLKFKSINFDFPYINAFFWGLDDIENGCNKDEHSLCLKYEKSKKDVKYHLNENFSLQIIHYCKTSHSKFGTGKSEMLLCKHIKIISKKWCNINDFIDIINNLIKFFSLSLKRRLMINNIWSESNENTAKRKLFISTFQYKILNTNFEEEMDVWKTLLNYRYLPPHKMSKVLKKFFELTSLEYRNFQAIIDLYLRNQDAPFEVLSQVEILIYSTALEAYVSTKDYNKNKTYKKTYEDLIKEIKTKYPQVEELSKIPSRQYSYAEKIKRCIEYESIIEVCSFRYCGKNKYKLITDIVNTRNYFTHYSFSANDKKIKDIDLWELKDRLRILLEIFILNELDIDKKTIKSIIMNNNTSLLEFYNDYLWIPDPKIKSIKLSKNFLGEETFFSEKDEMPKFINFYYEEFNKQTVKLICKYRQKRICTKNKLVKKNITEQELKNLPKYFQECYKRYKLMAKQNDYKNN